MASDLSPSLTPSSSNSPIKHLTYANYTPLVLQSYSTPSLSRIPTTIVHKVRSGFNHPCSCNPPPFSLDFRLPPFPISFHRDTRAALSSNDEPDPRNVFGVFEMGCSTPRFPYHRPTPLPSNSAYTHSPAQLIDIIIHNSNSSISQSTIPAA